MLEKRRNASLHRSRQPETPQLTGNAYGISHMHIQRRPETSFFPTSCFRPQCTRLCRKLSRIAFSPGITAMVMFHHHDRLAQWTFNLRNTTRIIALG